MRASGVGAPVVTADVWRMPASAVPATLLAVARDRRRLRRIDGARFVKVLGTAERFDGRSADLTRWMILTAWTDADTARRASGNGPLAEWQRRSSERWRAVLRPIAARGAWSRSTPFEVVEDEPGLGGSWTGPVAAVTRARLAPSKAAQFWRAVPGAAGDLSGRDGLRFALAVGEAPIGVQGTFSLWRDGAALREYAYRRPAHRAVVKATREVGWYAEELFARFAVLETAGSIDGRDPAALS